MQDVTGLIHNPTTNAELNNRQFKHLVENVIRNPYNALVEALHDMFVGAVFEYACATAPDGMLLCDGSAVSRTTYAKLFARIGTTWGAGDGSTTFNLPTRDKGRVGVGAGTAASGTTFTLGQTGGEEKHTLTKAELPNDAPGINIGGTLVSWGKTGGGDQVRVNLAGEFGGIFTGGFEMCTNGNGGENAPHNNMPPYAVMNFFIVY